MTEIVPYDMMAPSNFDEAVAIAKTISQSGMVPERYENNHAAVMVALQFGKEVGLPGLQALQSIYIVNGQPALYGDGSLAVCMRHKDWAGKKEPKLSEIREQKKAEVTVYRKGCEPVTQDFSLQEAMDAGLYYKDPKTIKNEKYRYKYMNSAWYKWWPRMLLWRARGFALRDQFADALKGIAIAEELDDYLETKVQILDAKADLAIENASKIKEPEAADEGWFQKNMGRFFGKKTAKEREEEVLDVLAGGGAIKNNPIKDHIDGVIASEAGREGRQALEDQPVIDIEEEEELTGREAYDKEAAELGFISSAQRDEITCYISEKMLEGGAVDQWLQKHSVNSVNEIPAVQFDDLFAELKRVTS